MKYFKLISSFLTCLLFAQMSISQDFVYLENNTFKLDREDFYPVVMNYGVNFRTNGKDFWAVPAHGYGRGNDIECTGEADCLETIKADMQLLQDLGFNAIRLFNVRPHYFINGNQLAFPAFTSNSVYQNEIDIPMQPDDYSIHFKLISDVLEVVEEVGLKVIILTGGPIYDPIREEYIEALLNDFATNSTIFAYDFINEPLYEDSLVITKKDACEIVSNWRYLMDTYAPDHLLTVGFANSTEILKWDPDILPIDFASFHPYGSVESVQNEIYYYGQYITKPWIIGETGLAADDIIVSYEEQRDFAEKTLKRTINCGGNGYSWWQYQDVWWGSYGLDYIGLLNHNDITQTSDPSLTVEGTPKPAAQEFQKIGSYSPTYDCPCLSSFYNYPGYNNYIITGRLINGNTNQPIDGGLIYGWKFEIVNNNEVWTNNTKTFSKPDGTFNLHGEIMLNKLSFSAPSFDRTWQDISWNSSPINLSNGIVNIGETKTYKTSSSITASNYTVKGDGSNGGSLTLYAGRYITFNTGFSVEKGGVLIAEPKYDIGDIKVYPITCSSPLESANQSSEDNLATEILNQDEDLNTNYINLYPNPTNGIINIVSSNSSIESISVYNQNGQLVISKLNVPSNYQLDLLNQPSGMYFVVIYSGNQNYKSKFIFE